LSLCLGERAHFGVADVVLLRRGSIKMSFGGEVFPSNFFFLDAAALTKSEQRNNHPTLVHQHHTKYG
jgi:hypothetical protein